MQSEREREIEICGLTTAVELDGRLDSNLLGHILVRDSGMELLLGDVQVVHVGYTKSELEDSA